MVDKRTVRKVAETARLSLTEEELKEMGKDLNSIIDAFKILKTVPVTKPSFQPIEVKNVTRKDEVEPSLPREKALANTKQKERGYFKGPRVV